MLSTDTIITIRSLGDEPNRPFWKYKELTPRQIQILAEYVKLSDLSMLDRGKASLLIDCIFMLHDKESPINDVQIIDAINEIIASEK